MSNVADIAQRIAANACIALQHIRDGNPFPEYLFDDIERDSRLVRKAFKKTEAVESAVRL